MNILRQSKCLLLAIFSLIIWQTETFSQNLNYEIVKVKHRRVPKQPLGDDILTYSSTFSAVDLEQSRAQLESMKSKNLKLEGYTLEQEGADISIELIVDALGFNSRELIDNSTTKKEGETEVKVPAYQYSLNYDYPFKLRVTNNISGEVLLEEEDLMPISFVYPEKNSASSTTQLANSYETNKAGIIQSIRKYGINKLLSHSKFVINDNFGYPVIEHSFEMGYVKKYKKYDYSDLYAAFEDMRLGLNQLEEDWYTKPMNDSPLHKALDAFVKVKEEYNPGDKKARINEKVVFMVNHNAAICNFFLKDFSKCEEYLSGIGKKASYRIKLNQKYLEDFIVDVEQRYTANNIKFN